MSRNNSRCRLLQAWPFGPLLILQGAKSLVKRGIEIERLLPDLLRRALGLERRITLLIDARNSSILLNAVAAREKIIDDGDGNQDHGPNHAEGGELSHLSIFPKLEDRHGDHRRLRADEQHRHR
jgi:hypothetical protein